MPTFFKPRVVFQPESYIGMQQGINQLAEAIRPTLGPHPRVVANEHPLRQRAPELLDSGGVVARKILELPGRTRDAGAMFLRHIVQHVHEQAGDGAATTAVLLQAVYNEGIKYLAAGGNAMRLREYLNTGCDIILAELQNMTLHLDGEEQLAQIAETVCHDPPLAKMLGEIFDIIGEYGRLDINAGKGRELERKYIEGVYWPSTLLSREMISDHKTLRADVHDAAILMTNLDIEDPMQLVPAVSIARRAKFSSLVVIAHKLSEKAIAFLLANSQSDDFKVIAVKVSGMGGTKQAGSLQDLVMLAGGKAYLKELGEISIERATAADLGYARKVWANLHNFGIVGGKGDPRALRQHIAQLRAAYKITTGEDKQELQQRISKLISGSAILTVGAPTNAEARIRKATADRGADTVRGAMLEGVLPGGGVSLLACRTVLQGKLSESSNVDERAAFNILIKAVEAPFRTIMSNSGYEPSEILAKIRLQQAEGCGFDVRTGQVVNMVEAGIFDSAKAQKMAAQSAITSAALALTTEVLVQHKNPRPPAMQGPGPGWYKSSKPD